MKEFVIKSYLYLPAGTSKGEAFEVVENNLTNYSVKSIEDRGHEVAVDFDVIVESKSKEDVEKWFLNTMFEYDVDNYVINEL